MLGIFSCEQHFLLALYAQFCGLVPSLHESQLGECHACDGLGAMKQLLLCVEYLGHEVFGGIQDVDLPLLGFVLGGNFVGLLMSND